MPLNDNEKNDDNDQVLKPQGSEVGVGPYGQTQKQCPQDCQSESKQVATSFATQRLTLAMLLVGMFLGFCLGIFAAGSSMKILIAVVWLQEAEVPASEAA